MHHTYSHLRRISEKKKNLSDTSIILYIGLSSVSLLFIIIIHAQSVKGACGQLVPHCCVIVMKPHPYMALAHVKRQHKDYNLLHMAFELRYIHIDELTEPRRVDGTTILLHFKLC